MADSLIRGFNRILNKPTLSLLRTYFIRDSSLNHPYLGGNGWTPSTNLLVTCRYKSSGHLNAGNSAGRRVENGELYGPLQIGKASKKSKSKRKYPSSLPTTTQLYKGIQSLPTTSLANKTTGVNSSFISSINNITKPGKSSQKKSSEIGVTQNKDKSRKTGKVKNALEIDKWENVLNKKNFLSTGEESMPTSFIVVNDSTGSIDTKKSFSKEHGDFINKKAATLSQKDSNLLENEEKSQKWKDVCLDENWYKNNERSDQGVYGMEQSDAAEKKTRKNIILPLANHTGKEPQTRLTSYTNKENVAHMKQSSSEPSVGFSFVPDEPTKSPKLNKKSSQIGTTSSDEFNTSIDALIDELPIDRWETLVQKSLLETSKKTPPTSFILVDDSSSSSAKSKKAVSDEHLFLDPRDQMETYVFGHGSQPCQNTSRVPNNTAKLSSPGDIGELKPDLPRKTASSINSNKTEMLKSQAIDYNSQPVLTVQPNENINGKQSRKFKENGDNIIKKNSCEQKSTFSNDSFDSSIDFYNKSIWSKELLAAVERSKKLPTSGLQDQKVSSQRNSEIWASPTRMLDLKRGKKGKKLKDDIFSGDTLSQRNSAVSFPDTKASKRSSAGVENNTIEFKPCVNGASCAKEKLQEHMKSEFRQNYLDMQKKRLNKNSSNTKSDQSTLVHTPNSMAKWMVDTEGIVKGNVENNPLIKAGKKQKNKTNESSPVKHGKKNVDTLSSDSIINACLEHQIRDKRSNVTKSFDPVLFSHDTPASKNEVKEKRNNYGNKEKETYYVLSDERLEDFVNGKNDNCNNNKTIQEKRTMPVKTSGLLPMLQNMDGFMTMTVTPVNDDFPSPKRSESQLVSTKMTTKQQSDMQKQNDDLFDKNRLLRNMLAMRRYHDRVQREKEEKKRKKKKSRRRNGSSSGERQQRTPVRSSKRTE